MLTDSGRRLLLTAAVVIRVFGPGLLPASYTAVAMTAGTVWVCAFLVYLVIYSPILLAPRVDGKPGYPRTRRPTRFVRR